MKILVDNKPMPRHNLPKEKTSPLESKKVTNRIEAKVGQALYAILAEESLRTGISMGELLTRAYADAKGCPELGFVEKERAGRKPRKHLEPVPA